ncbi:MAG: class I SAM-dependent methyltransferase [Halopenitus sp.]
MPDWKTDAAELATQYGDSANLSARVQLHDRFSTADVDLREWIFQQMELPAASRILSLGCGDGDLWPDVRESIPASWDLVLTDRSPEMVTEASERVAASRPGTAVAQVDARSIPFHGSTFDAVTANHMLYHVPDRERAIAEIADVLRPSGTLYATTNGAGHMAEVLDVIDACVDGDVARPSNFTLENGRAQLRRSFETVESATYPGSLRVPEMDPLVAYALSRPEFSREHVAEFVERVRERSEDGVFEITKNTGLFVATDPQ